VPNNLSVIIKTDVEESNIPPQPIKPESIPPAKKPRPAKQTLLLWLLIVLLASSSGVFAYLYFTNSDSTANPADQPTAESDQPGAEMTSTGSPSLYQAEVGKFSLTLPVGYYVIEKIDGGFEGGPVTSIVIGQVDEEVNNLIHSSAAQEFEIIALPLTSTGATTLAEYGASTSFGSSELSTQLENTTFSGVDALVYRQDGLFTTTHLAFINAAVAYSVSFVGSSPADNDLYAVVEEAFSFD